MRRSPALLFVVPALALAATACGDDDSTSMPETTMAPEPGHGTVDHDDTSAVADGARRIPVRATSFAFEPARITVTAGEDVAIELTSDDLLHDFTVEDLDAHVAADRGETATGGLRADRAGRYTYYCTVPGHREAGMEGTLVVDAP